MAALAESSHVYVLCHRFVLPEQRRRRFAVSLSAVGPWVVCRVLATGPRAQQIAGAAMPQVLRPRLRRLLLRHRSIQEGEDHVSAVHSSCLPFKTLQLFRGCRLDDSAVTVRRGSGRPAAVRGRRGSQFGPMRLSGIEVVHYGCHSVMSTVMRLVLRMTTLQEPSPADAEVHLQ